MLVHSFWISSSLSSRSVLTVSRYLCQLADAGAQFFGYRLAGAQFCLVIVFACSTPLLEPRYSLSASLDAGIQLLVIVIAFSTLLLELRYSADWLVQPLLEPDSVPPDDDLPREVRVLGQVVHLFASLCMCWLFDIKPIVSPSCAARPWGGRCCRLLRALRWQGRPALPRLRASWGC